MTSPSKNGSQATRGSHKFAPKLTDKQTGEIARRYRCGEATQAQLAEEYGVTTAAINYHLRRHLVTHEDKAPKPATRPRDARPARPDKVTLLLVDEDDLDWQEDALCSATDPEAFFPEKGGSTRAAKRVCEECVVRAECLDYALTGDIRFGIWGGLSERERAKLRRKTERPAQQPATGKNTPPEPSTTSPKGTAA
jgi:WhiB family redox-sensing transcriptional regulator